MKNRFKFMAALSIVAAALFSCTSLEVTLPKGPQGEQGIQGVSGVDGLTAYEVWLKAVKEGSITGWDKSKTEVHDYFLYLKGEKGDKGDSGSDGLSAYEIWKVFISSGNVESPLCPDEEWSPEDDSLDDFYRFLTGPKGDDGLIPYIGENGNWFIGDSDTGIPATGPSGKDGEDGEDGLSAYNLWVEFIQNGGDDAWPVENTEMYQFFLYLKGEKGEKGDKGDEGEKGETGDSGDTPYIGEDGNWHVGESDTGIPATGPEGEDGLSAYELWKAEVLSETGLANPGNGVYDLSEYPLWPSSAVDLSDFFLYLSGVDGEDGLSAYELWKQYISSGNVEDPKNPGTVWDSAKNSEADFYYYLTGPAGDDGLSAYELWKEEVLSDAGLANPDNGVYDIIEYPLWPTSAVSLEDFWLYLRGKDGVDGENGSGYALTDTAYVERVDTKLYNVAPVIALSKTVGETLEYEYVNPISGGAAFIVTGPGPVIIPGCEVTFTDLSGTITYTKTSDSQGYIYLTRDELPEWSEGAPSAKDTPDDFKTGVKPISFAFGSTTVTDQSKIAATCKVPYKVGLTVVSTNASLRDYSVHADFRVYRVVEGVTEEEPFIYTLAMLSSLSGSYSRGDLGYWPMVNSSVFHYYRNEGVEILLSRVASEASLDTAISSLDAEAVTDWFSDINHLCGARAFKYSLRSAIVSRSRSKDSSVSWFNVSFGNGSSPSTIGVYDLMLETIKGVAYSGAGNLLPDYGLKLTDKERSIMLPPYYSMPKEVEGSFVWDSGHTTLDLNFTSEALSTLKSIVVYTGAGGWTSSGTKYSFSTSTVGAKYSSPSTSFTVKGTYDGSTLNSTVSFNLYKTLSLTDVYDKFKMTVSDYLDGVIVLGGFSGTFSYTRGEDKAYAFGCEIEATEKNVTDN